MRDYMTDWPGMRWQMNAQQPEAPMPKMPAQHTQPIGPAQPVGNAAPGGFMPPFAGYQGQWGQNWNPPQPRAFGWNPQGGPNWLQMMGWRL